MKKLPKKVYYAVLLLIIGFTTYFAFLVKYAKSPVDKTNTQIIVEIPAGSSFLKITEILSEAGVVKSHLLFYGLAISKHALRSIRAGEYEFNTSMTPSDILAKLLRSEIKIYRITIPEDLSMMEIAGRLKEYKLINEETFFDLAEDEEFLKSSGINARSVEGYLFPDTYIFDRTMSTRQIMLTMVNQFWKKVTPAMLNRARKLGLSTQQYITLASMIGKESGNSSEKSIVSAVFHNRLKKKMRLQSDPTAVYDLENFEGAVRRSHLKRNSPYNTYLISGLPPGPIANPGLDSLKAAIYPARFNYLYFVSQGDGSHFFSYSLESHNVGIARYRQIKNKK
jgi:UPF0755 protein